MSSDSGLFRRSSLPSPIQQQSQQTSQSMTSFNTMNTSTGLFISNNNKNKKECFNFEPQQWRKTVCKNCFRTQPEHKILNNLGNDEMMNSTLKSQLSYDNDVNNNNNNNVSGVGSISEDNTVTPTSTTIITTTTTTTTPTTTTTNSSSSGSSSSSSYEMKSRDSSINKSNNNGLIGSNAAARAAARKIAVGQRYSDSDVRNHEIRKSSNLINTTGQQSTTGINHSSASSIDARYVEELENDFFALEDKHELLQRERDELNLELEVKIRTISELQATLDQYREKVSLLERRCGHLEEEVKSYRERLRLPESDQNHSPNTTILEQQHYHQQQQQQHTIGLTDIHCSAELQQRLNEVEQLCQEVMEENEQLKEDVEEMHREIEEMHDHFQEEDRDAVRELQRDLEAANKACRILQFKLRKAERRFEQCEAERANLEERLARLESELYSEADVAHIHNLEEELRVAKEVGVRLNNELDLLDEKRVYYEEENRQLNEELQTSQNKRIAVENELGRLKLEFDKLKNEKGAIDKGPLQVTDKNRSRQGVSLSREASFEEHQIMRDLEAAKERETDLSEQLRFAEEEIRKIKRRLKESQAENDILSRKMGKIFSLQTRDNRLLEQTAVGENVDDQQVIPSTISTVNVEQNKKFTSGISGRVRNQLNTENEGLILTGNRLSQNSTNINTSTLLNNEKHTGIIDKSTNQTLYQESSTESLLSNEYKQKLDEAIKENTTLKHKLRDTDKQLKQILRDVRVLSSCEKTDSWFEKYNDLHEIMKDQENEISRMKKKLIELQNENIQLRTNEKNLDKPVHNRKPRTTRLELMSQELLIEEIKNLEEELDKKMNDLSIVNEQVNNIKQHYKQLEEITQDNRLELNQHVNDLIKYLSSTECKCTVLNELLTMLDEQNNNLLIELSSLLSVNYATDDQSSMTKKTDEISGETIKVEDPHQKIKCLEKLLSEEHQRTLILQKRLELAIKPNICIDQNSEKQLDTKRSEMLQKELDEKEEILDARDEQIADLKSRVEQMRKMNEAMRTLMEKEPTEIKPQKLGTNVEITSYKKEVECMRKEMQIIRNNLIQAEKIKEKLTKENRELQEELKLREDSIFEQDDELERRNNEIRGHKSSIEQMKRELEQTKRDLAQAKAAEISGASGRLSTKIAEIERLRTELNNVTQELKDTKTSHEELKRISKQNDDTMKHLGNEVLQLRNAIIEKDKMLTELHAYLKESRQNVESMKLQCENAETKRNDAEKRYEEIKDKLTNKDQELKNLRKRMEEAVSMNSTSNILTTTISNNRDSTQQDSSHTNRDLMLNRRGFEVDKLRRELSLTKREKDDLYIELKKLRCKLDKRHTSEERGRKDITGYLTNLNMGNTYAKAISAQQPTTKIALLNEHIGILNRANAELKIQNESLHNSVIDYQRRYRSIKEQYEGEQEAWITERLVLESKAKEQEDRRTTITNTRKLLQDTSVKLFDLEKESEKKLTNLQTAYEKLEKEKQTIELKLAQLEDTQKLPKVLQRFNASSSSSIRPSVLTSQVRTAQLENQEIILKLQNAERIISKLRSELIEMKELHATQSIAAVQEAEEARLSMERELEDIKDRLLTMECYRQQVELFRHRHFELEETAEKEYKIWQEERDHLIYQAEAARVMIDQWSTQIKCKVTSFNVLQQSKEILNEILKSMEKWSTEHERLPNLKRRMLDSVSSIESTSGIGLSTGATNSPLITQSPKGGLMISSTISPFSPNLLAKGSTLTAQRSTSMEWTSSRFHGPSSGHSFGLNFRENSIGLGGATISGTSLIGGFRGSALSLATNTGVGGGSNYSLMVNSRCGRSVSPEVTVKKISNYPDPTLGFLVRPTSRQGSQDSLASITDYSQRSFTLPGM
ncbi:Protein SOGA3 [Schistosoma japonicum]|nr:Protein SOGA3 [Schistosoma japonicum]